MHTQPKGDRLTPAAASQYQLIQQHQSKQERVQMLGIRAQRRAANGMLPAASA
jgi:hypothetical protein